ELDLEARLENDAPLRAELEAMQRLREAIRDGADHHAAPPALRAIVQALPQRWLESAPAPAPASVVVRAARSRTARLFAAAALACAVVIATVVGIVWQQAPQDALAGEAVASHVRATLGQHLVDVASSDRHAVKPWLSARLDFSPPLPEAVPPGALFLGGRIDYLDTRPVAALVYRQREHVIDSFVWPAGDAADSAMTQRSLRGFNALHWIHAGMTHWVVSDLNRDELVAFAQALDAGAAPR
ncbi:MAG: hypothetical protein ABI809_11360, partial [Caldimonas sp.]